MEALPQSGEPDWHFSPGPRVTVVITTCRRPVPLMRAISSVLAQDYESFELLVIDDCVADETREAALSFDDERVRYVPQDQNTGVAGARNRGMREAKGEFIAFLDDDDEWRPGKLSRQIELMDSAGQETGLVYTGMTVIGPDGESRQVLAERGGSLLPEMLARNVVCATSSVVIRKKVIDEVGFFDETFPAIEDYEYWIRVAARYDLGFNAEPLVRYYDDQPAPSDDQQRRSQRWRANLQAREQLYRRYLSHMQVHGQAALFLLDTLNRIVSHREGTRWQAYRVGWQIASLFPPRLWIIRDVFRALRKRNWV